MRERPSADVALLLAHATRSGRPAGEASGTHMAGLLQSTLLADEDQSLSLGEPHLKSRQGAKQVTSAYIRMEGWLRKQVPGSLVVGAAGGQHTVAGVTQGRPAPGRRLQLKTRVRIWVGLQPVRRTWQATVCCLSWELGGLGMLRVLDDKAACVIVWALWGIV